MLQCIIVTHNMYVMTPRDHISQDLSYFSGPRTSGAKPCKVTLKHLLKAMNVNVT